MKFPLVICAGKVLKIAGPDFFDFIGKLKPDTGFLEINVTKNGSADFKWVLDADGIFRDLALIGLMPLGLLHRLGLRSPREKYRIIPGRRISVHEIADLISELHDQFEEAPDVSILKELLTRLSPDQIVGPEVMSAFLRE